jgi:hypothetical protein
MTELARSPVAPTSPTREARHGFVSKAPAALGQPFQVVVPEFDDQQDSARPAEMHAYEIRRWQSRATTIPAVGDEVLVVVDDQQEPWVAAWWPAGGDTPIKGGEGTGDKTYLHEQGVAAKAWTVKHNLGKTPCVIAFDGLGRQIEPQVEVLNSNELKLLFNAESSGKAVMN